MKHILFFLVIAMCCTCVATAQNNLGSLTNNKVENVESSKAEKLSYLTASISNERVLMNWAIENNKDTDRFEVERSTDGKSFKMVALVFGSELTGLAEYSFFEKVKKVKTYYRLKIVYKNGTADYSDVVMP
jgi:hypothetical protein